MASQKFTFCGNKRGIKMSFYKFCPDCQALCKGNDARCDCGYKFISEEEMEFERQKLMQQIEDDVE